MRPGTKPSAPVKPVGVEARYQCNNVSTAQKLRQISSVPNEPTRRQCIASVQPMGAESTAVRASEGQWLIWSHVWPVEPMVPHRFNRRLCRKVHNDYKRLFLVGGLYICLSPAIWSLLQFKETPYTLKNTSKPSKHTIVSESTRLAQVWVREQGVVCYAWADSPASLRPSDLVWSGIDDFVQGM